jgi:hypothetical protein
MDFCECGCLVYWGCIALWLLFVNWIFSACSVFPDVTYLGGGRLLLLLLLLLGTPLDPLPDRRAFVHVIFTYFLNTSFSIVCLLLFLRASATRCSH